MIENITYRAADSADADVLCNFWLALMREHEQMDPRLVLSEDAAVLAPIEINFFDCVNGHF